MSSECSCRSVVPGLKKIWMDDLGDTLNWEKNPLKMVYLLRTKTCASFGLINLLRKICENK